MIFKGQGNCEVFYCPKWSQGYEKEIVMRMEL